MVTRVNHGGRCCGAGHLYGFGDAEENDPDLIDRALAQVPSGRETNVMLNLTQMRSHPRTLQRLADRGFVLTGHFINDNHGSHVFQFSRADKRHAFDAESLRALNVVWPGMVISETLEGTMPNLPARPQNNGARPANSAVYHRAMEHVDGPEGIGGRYRVRANADRPLTGNQHVFPGLIGTMTRWDHPTGRDHENVSYFNWAYPRPQEWRAGERYRINSPRSRRHNQEFELIRVIRDYYGNRKAVFHDRDGEFEISTANCVFIPGEGQVPAVPVIPEMRHTHRQVLVRPDEAPRVVASLWANRYRRTGRSNTRFGSYDAAVAGRSTRATGVVTDRLDILSDASEVWTEDVQA